MNNLFIDAAAMRAAGNPRNAITYEDETALSSNDPADLLETQDRDLSAARNRGASERAPGTPARRHRRSRATISREVALGARSFQRTGCRRPMTPTLT